MHEIEEEEAVEGSPDEDNQQPPNGVLVLVELGEEGAEGVTAIQPLGDVRLSSVLTLLKKATKLHEEQLGL
jgi:hypothetical protein